MLFNNTKQTTTSVVDFFDSSFSEGFTFFKSIQVSCCRRYMDTVTIKTSDLGAVSPCLSGNCTGDPVDCRSGRRKTQQEEEIFSNGVLF